MSEIKIKPLPGYRFAQNARVDCVGVHVRAGGIPVGVVTGYEMVNRELVLTVHMDVETAENEIDPFLGQGFD